MTIRILFFIIGTILFFNSLSAKELNKLFQLIPLPQKIEITGEKEISWNEISYIIAEENTGYPVLSDVLDRLPRHTKKGKGVFLKQKKTDILHSEEGYILEIKPDKIRIEAQTEAGLFYGCQTLAQLMEDSRDFNITIPSMKITDYPALPFRAVHFDVKHHLDHIDYYYNAIDKLARYKINTIIWEIEDKLHFSRHPEISAPNAISKQEMQAISRYAHERHIEISPLVQGLGHASFILKHHWELREDPQSDWGFCPSDPRTYELQFDLYRDAMEAFPYGKYLHIGGDEVSRSGTDERCLATGKTPFELQMTWLRKVCRFVVENGRTPIFWDDMPLKHAGIWNLFWNNLSDKDLDKVWNTGKLDEAIELFPKECIYMRWNYFDIVEPINERVLEWYRNKGLKVMGSTAAAAGDSPLIPRNDSRLKEIIGFNRLAAKCNLAGMLTTAWDDGSPHWETVMRGFIAQGEFGWNPSGRSLQDFIVAHSRREFGFDGTGDEMVFLRELEQAMFFYDSALIESGNRNPAYQCGDFVLIDLPDPSQPEKWSEKYKNKIEQAQKEAERYKTISTQLKEAQHRAIRNRYTLEIYEQINELQIFPSHLLVALSLYDKATHPDARKQAVASLKDLCTAFYTLRTTLENVYGKTRFMSMPEGYLAGSNHPKNMAARTYNNDWMFLYELPMVKQIEKWLNRFHLHPSLNSWKAGSANDDVFLDMTQADMDALVQNGLELLEIDWLYATEKSPEEITAWALTAKEHADKAGVTIWSVHLPFGGPFDISQTNDSLRRQAVELNKQDMRLSARLVSPQKFIIHPSAEPISNEERAARIAASRKSLQELASTAKELNINLLVENLPRTCLGNTSTELLDIVDGIDNTAICFDVNHLLTESHASFIQNTKGKIQSTHMSDYDRKNERHWLPGEGVIDWRALLDRLVESGYPGPFIYEASKGKEPALVSIQTLGDKWKELRTR